MYDYPYRLERDVDHRGHTSYLIKCTGEGAICKGDDFNEMRRLVDAINEVERQSKEHNGR